MRFRILLASLTLLGLSSGYLSWMLYESSPGRAARPPARYPESNPLPRLLLFLHPRCPCSRATLAELARLRPAKIHLEIVLSQQPPSEMMESLQSSFPEAEVMADAQGYRRELYRAWTSGQLIGYDREGRLGFCGGITASRGQSGACLGQAHLQAWLRGQPPQAASVFGCPLVHPDELCSQRQGIARRCQ